MKDVEDYNKFREKLWRNSQMRIFLLRKTEKPYELIWYSAKNCYHKKVPEFNMEKAKIFVAQLTRKKHHNPFEHLYLTIEIKNCSRSFMAQLTRHRIASYTIHSQHFALHKDFKYKMLEWENQHVQETYRNLMNAIRETYELFINLKVPRHIAREILPNSTLTNIIMTANLREFKYILGLRQGLDNCPEMIKFCKYLQQVLESYLPEYIYDLD